MCGICGRLNFDRTAAVSPVTLKAMADSIAHRGPDDEGFYLSGSVGFGFRRLSIIDLSTGHQPISNEDGSVWIVFNGEIYNYQELRQDLLKRGHIFKSNTDTEVIVHLFEEFGESCVSRLRGMFAFAIWDARDRRLMLARDRIGIKPLYYRLTAGNIIFGSEIKAILADPEVGREVRPEMIDRFLTFGYVPGEETLFHGVQKLAPGSYLLVKSGKTEVKQYWDLEFKPRRQEIDCAQEQLLELLEECVGLHMISDVPVGFLLSGGVDSTALLNFAVGKTDHKLSSYTIGFSDPGVTDERPYARLAASLYGSEHREISIGFQQFVDFLPQYVKHMEEPVCEPPAVALYYISKLARSYVKVLISGEGGDEAFAGYPNYPSMLWMERIKTALGPLNGVLSNAATVAAKLPGCHKLRKYAPLLKTSFDSYYYSRTSTPFRFFNANADHFYTSDFRSLCDKNFSAEPARRCLRNSTKMDVLSRMLYVDSKTWLPDDLLIKADKITMANSVELRVPLLDHKLLEFAASLPTNFKVRGFTSKYIAKRTLQDRVPKEILERPKAGFPVPYEFWLKGQLRGWLNEILLDRTTLSRGYFKKNAIQTLLSKNAQSGTYAKELFSLAVLELWHREFVGAGTATSEPMHPQPVNA